MYNVNHSVKCIKEDFHYFLLSLPTKQYLTALHISYKFWNIKLLGKYVQLFIIITFVHNQNEYNTREYKKLTIKGLNYQTFSRAPPLSYVRLREIPL